MKTKHVIMLLCILIPAMGIHAADDQQLSTVELYTLTLNQNPSGGGSVIANPDQDTYEPGTSVQLTVEPNPGYIFFYWSGDLGDGSNPETIVMDSNKNVTANFGHTLEVVTDPVGKGDVTISPNRDIYTHNEAVQLFAEPVSGYRFKCWSGSVNSTENPLNISMITNKEIVACFESDQYKLRMQAYPEGTGFTVPSLGDHWYDNGTVVQISAQAEEGYVFYGWEGDVDDMQSQTTTVTMDRNRDVWACFVPNQATLEMKVNIQGAGTTTPPVGIYTIEKGETVAISADPAEGYRFKCWEGNVANPHAADTEILMESDAVVKAHFELDQFKLRMNVYPEDGGVTNPEQGDHWFANGTVVQIAADSHEGYAFSHWEGDVGDPQAGHTYVTMDANKTVCAKFQSTQATLEMKVNIEGAGTTTPSVGIHTYDLNETVTVTAHPAEGYRFKCWDGYVADPNSATTTITLIHNKTVVAYFESLSGSGKVTLHLKSGEGGITSPPMGEYCYAAGTVVELLADPSAGYIFDHWMGPVANRYSAATTVKMEESCVVKALFITKNVKLKMAVSPDEGGTTSPETGEHWMERGTVMDIQAVPNPGYTFRCWDGPVADVHSPSTTVTMDESHTVKACFTLETQEDQVKLKLKTHPDEGGQTVPVQGEYLYPQGEIVQIEAVPVEGYAFWYWDGPVADPDSAMTTVTLDESCTVWAKFRKTGITLTMRIKPDDAGDTAPALGEHAVGQGDTIRIEAFANPGYTFKCWSGLVENPYENPTSFVIEHDTEIKAVFEEPDTSPPEFSQLFPHPGSQNVPKNTKIQIKGRDNQSGVDPATVQVGVNGDPIVQNGQDMTGGAVEMHTHSTCFKLFYDSPDEFPEGSTITVTAAFGNRANPQIMTDTTFTFTIGKTEIENKDGKEMGAEGGTVTHEGANVTITVPVEALDDTVEITINQAGNLPELPDEAGAMALGYHFGPDGLQFNKPVQIKFPYTEADLLEAGVDSPWDLVIYYYHTTTGSWSVLAIEEVDTENQLIYVTISEFCYLAMGSPQSVSAAVQDGTVPLAYDLSQNWPNPFNPETTLRYRVAEPAHVRIRVYNTGGRLVCTLVNRQMTAGSYDVIWNGRDDLGNSISSGMYLIQMRVQDHVFVRKVSFLK